MVVKIWGINTANIQIHDQSLYWQYDVGQVFYMSVPQLFYW